MYVNVTKLACYVGIYLAIYLEYLTTLITYKTMIFQILTDVYVLFLDDKSWKIHVYHFSKSLQN